MRDELVVVGLGGATASPGIAPGIDLVSLSRATEISALAIYDDIDITREQLFKIGQGKGYKSILNRKNSRQPVITGTSAKL
jgi:hypothetical protein